MFRLARAKSVSAALSVFATLLFVVGCASNPTADTISGEAPSGLSAADVQAAVLEGCSARGWACKVIDDKTIEGSIWVRGKHFVKVNIVSSQYSFQINYADSENLEYDPETNTIHGGYQSWVTNLMGDIANALLRKAA
jgi:hypothetical protein